MNSYATFYWIEKFSQAGMGICAISQICHPEPNEGSSFDAIPRPRTEGDSSVAETIFCRPAFVCSFRMTGLKFLLILEVCHPELGEGFPPDM